MHHLYRLKVQSDGTLMPSSWWKTSGRGLSPESSSAHPAPFYPGLLWGIRHLKSKEDTGLVLHHCDRLYRMRGSHLLSFFFLCFGLGQSLLRVVFLAVKGIIPSSLVLYLSPGYLPFRCSMLPPGEWHFALHLSSAVPCWTLYKQHQPRSVHFKCNT